MNNVRWDRTWVNRRVYVHPYPAVHRYAVNQHVAEHHELVSRSENERAAAREGHEVHEEHAAHGHDHHR